MKNRIISKLYEIEKEQEVKILYAVESGSRGWGFASRDSDYDVRFIYVHRLDWYLSIEEKRDVIEYPSSGLDISGWDIKKTLKLFKNSNPPLYEWLNSPIVYFEKENFAQKLRALISKFYSSKSCLYHYLQMAKGNYRDYLKGEKVKVKKYFYVLRPILACMWIEKHKTVPPMEFEKLLHAQKLDEKLVDEIEKLLKKKRSGDEMGIEKKIEIINDFLENKLAYFEEFIKTSKEKNRRKKEGILDNLFRETIRIKE